MRSIVAALRNLTLPYGTTSGTRIVLDGVQGTIRFYDSGDNVVIDQQAATGTIAVGEDASVVLDGGNEGLFLYSGTPADGNLIGSWAVEAGTDDYGNSYPAGIYLPQGALTGVTIDDAEISGGTVTGSSLINTDITSPTIQGGTITQATIKIDETSGAILIYESTTTTATYTTAGAATWTCPADVTTAKVECWGAGGGGEAGTGSHGGGGGGGGEYACEENVVVTPSTVYDLVVGAGGSGGISSSRQGEDGGDTSFGSTTVVASGGSGGGADYTGDPGDGGTGSSATTHYNGGSGQGSGDLSGGGAGSSAGTAAAGADGSGVTGGTAPAGGGDGGDGYDGGVGSGDGSDGTQPGGGGGGSSYAGAASSTTDTYNPVHSYSYYGSGVGGGRRNVDGSYYQGSPNTPLTSYPGDQCSYVLYDYAQLRSDISGATIDKVTVTMSNAHTWYAGGMTVRLGYSTATSFGTTRPGSGDNVNVQSFTVGKGATVTKDITSAFTSALSTMTALMWGHTSTTSPTYYGYFSRSSTSPQLRVTHHTGATPTTGGDGADGKVVITYTTGTTLVGSWAPSSGTDEYGNNYPAGLDAADIMIGGNSIPARFASDTYDAETTDASGDLTIATGLTTVTGFTAMNANAASRNNVNFGIVSISGGNVTLRVWAAESKTLVTSTTVWVSWIAHGT